MTIYLPDELEAIESYWFSSSAVGSIFISKSVTEIRDNAFDGSHMLRQVTFAEDSRLKRIDVMAFSDTCIEAFSAPDTLLEIGIMAFFKCYNLELVQLNNGLKSIGELAFWGTDVKNLVLPPLVNSNLSKLSIDYN